MNKQKIADRDGIEPYQCKMDIIITAEVIEIPFGCQLDIGLPNFTHLGCKIQDISFHIPDLPYLIDVYEEQSRTTKNR